MLENIHDALLVYNPTSGGRRHRRFAEIEQAAGILKDAGVRTELAATTGRGSATKIARLAVEQGRGIVIACGGDGTVNEVVNGLAGSHVPMALLPAGTANILAKELGIPWHIPAAARLIPQCRLQRIALGMVLSLSREGFSSAPPFTRYFLCVAGAGPDGAVVRAISDTLKNRAGLLAYWLEGARQLVRYHFPEITISSAGRTQNATLIVVGRTAHYGGPFKITTGASLFEDSFEIVTNETRNRMKYLASLPALWLGRLRRLKHISAWKTTEAVCWPANREPVYAQADGEFVGELPVEFRLVPDALTLAVPANLRNAPQ